MDKSLYELMKEIYEQKKTEFSKDIKLIGTLTSEETSPNGKVLVTNDVFLIIDEMPDGTTSQRFVITGLDKDGKIYPAQEIAQDDISFLAQFQNMNKVEVVSLNEFDKQLEKVAKKLGISKEEVRSMSEIDLDKALDDKGLSKDDLDKDENEGQEANQDEKVPDPEVLNNIDAKQEIKTNIKVDDKYTLADILGVPAGSKLLVVYPTNIPDRSKLPYTTSLICMIQNPDGSIEYSDALTQVGGKDSDKNVYEVNRDGSRVEEKSVKSSFAIKSNIVKNGIITARIGSMGYIEVGFGYIDRTSNKDVVSERLEDQHTRYTTYEVRKEFSPREGVDNITDKMDEIKEHPEISEDGVTLAEADGNLATGHEEILDQIKAYNPDIADVFTNDEIMDRYHSMCEKNPESSKEDLIRYTQEDLSEDAEHMKGPMEH